MSLVHHPKIHRRHFAGGLMRTVCAVAVVSLALTLTACGERRDPTVVPTLTAPVDTGITVEQGIDYRATDGVTLALDACLPASAEPTAGVILLHGGGFTQGSRSDESIQSLCTWLAEKGYAAFPVSYRLAPDFIYPSQTDDVAAAVQWLRDPAQAARFNIDPARLGALGSSAGATIALQVAFAGEGDTATGSRLRAVVSLSGVADMTESGATLGDPTPEAASLILNYLGCESLETCDGTAASPIRNVDASDPATLLVGSVNDLVPIEQAESLAAALDAVGVPNELIVVDGAGHGAQLMNQDVRDAVTAFFSAHL